MNEQSADEMHVKNSASDTTTNLDQLKRLNEEALQQHSHQTASFPLRNFCQVDVEVMF